MRLLILDKYNLKLSPEVTEIIRQLNGNVTIFKYDKENLKDQWYYHLLKEYDPEEFVLAQNDHDAIYMANSSEFFDETFMIPYFYNIYTHTWSFKHEDNFDNFKQKYSQVKGASAVFVNDKKLNMFSHWLGLNTYYMNRPIKPLPFKRDRKFLTPKLNIGFIPSLSLAGQSQRNTIVEEMWSTFAKSNWTLHIPKDSKLEVQGNVIEHECTWEDYSQIYEHSHVLINPEDFFHDSIDMSYTRYDLEAMSNGCVSIRPNQTHTNAEYMFNDVHYIKLDYINSNTLVEALRYADKRREKLDRISQAGNELISKYYDYRKVVQQKIQIMRNSL